MALARKEALNLGHDFIGTTHLLVGLLEASPGEMLDLIGSAGTKPRVLVRRFEAGLPRRWTRWDAGLGSLPFTLAAKRALECTAEAASILADQVIEPSHLLLGLVLEKHGRAAVMLREFPAASLENLISRILEGKALDYRAIHRDLCDVSARSEPSQDDAAPPMQPERKRLRRLLLFVLAMFLSILTIWAFWLAQGG